MKKQIWQTHHLEYQPPKTVRLRRSEHWVVTQIQRFSGLSRGAKAALRYMARTKSEVKEGKLKSRKTG